jgi:predicted DNA repair protein MutK
MSGASLLTLLDDIATVLDDVALMTKVAAKKTAGVLGDDLALNAEQVNGVRAERELPVVWAVAKGSLKNKMIIVPLALLLSALAPWAIMPLLMIGGAYLCFEGFEKLAHKFLHSEAEEKAEEADLLAHVADSQVDLVAYEADKIKGAIRTDFVLSAEIIIITLGTVADSLFSTRVAVLVGVSLIMTVGVYGFVALIVKLDDMGFYLLRNENESLWHRLQRKLGDGLVAFAPWLMKALTVIGTVAMFMVGGGILTHGVHAITDFAHHLVEATSGIAYLGAVLGILIPAIVDILVGIVAGALVLAAYQLYDRFLAPIFKFKKPE